MNATPSLTVSATPTSTAVWIGRALSGLIASLLAFDATMKIVGERHAIEGTVGMGYDAAHVQPLGLLLLVCVALYVVPRTARLGAVLLTGWLGGAVAVHLQLGHTLATHTLFPLYVGCVVWAGLALRDPRARALVA